MPEELNLRKILEIGNYPPPMCGWAIQLRLLVEEIRRRGHDCVVLKINENRKQKSDEYVDVQNAPDFALKVLKFLVRGYSPHVHVNAESPKGYLLAIWPLLWCRLMRGESAMTFHGGVPQKFFPSEARWLRAAYRALFTLPHKILCNSAEIKAAIVEYCVPPEKIETIPGFSPEYLQFESVPLPAEAEEFLAARKPVFFSYLSYRPEYRLEILREGMSLIRQQQPNAGFIWLGFPDKEMPHAKRYVNTFNVEEKQALLLLGNLSHSEFLTLLQRCTATIRTPACDGISASVLESLALGVPVIASENGRRPKGTITYEELSPADLAAKIEFLLLHYTKIKNSLGSLPTDSNLSRTADWLLGTAKERVAAKVASSV